MEPSLSKRALNRQRWFERINAWKNSNQSQSAFCKDHHLGLASFQRWHRLFKTAAAGGIPAERAPVSFLPVRVREPVPTSKLTILVEDGLRIEVPVGVDPELLHQVIQVLRAS